MVQLTPTRYKLQTRILAPIVVFAVLVSGLIGFVFHSNYTTFQDRMNKQTEERANSLRKTFLHVIHEIEEYVAIINKNKLIQDNLLEDDKSEVLNALQLFIEHGFISLISIHGMDGTALAKTYAPGEIEKTDGISDFAREIAN
ncbi:MAG TPA: hypothetical protein ENI79_02560, partial [Rhodospirillales bacterium]|nr:hypothetical protein [Rhodospirillales bacterium]